MYYPGPARPSARQSAPKKSKSKRLYKKQSKIKRFLYEILDIMRISLFSAYSVLHMSTLNLKKAQTYV